MDTQNSALLAKEKGEDLSFLIDRLLEGIMCVHFDGTLTHCNAAAEKLLGKKRELALNSPFLKNFNDTFFGFSMTAALKEKKIERIHYCTLTLPKKTVELKIECHFGKENMILLFQDISHEKLAHASSRLKDLGTMTALLAHEIRNPLGGIKGFASLLRQDLEKEPHLKQMADLIIDGTDHLNALVTQILNFAHPLELKFKAVDLLLIVQNLKKSLLQDAQLNAQLLNGNITFKIVSPHEKVMVEGDALLLSSCLLNLMINAIQAMPNGGVLTTHLETDETSTTISISDTGTGISKENLKKIFSAFFTTKKQGNGFGLLEVHKVVQAHKGTIDVESEENKGTTFTLTFPKDS